MERLVYEGMDENEGLTVTGAGTFVHTPGANRDAGVVQLDKLDDQHALVVIQKEGAPLSLKSVELP